MKWKLIRFFFNSNRTIDSLETSHIDSPSSPTSASNSGSIMVYSTLWFTGLEIKQNTDSAVELDLTEPIQDFTDRGFTI